MSVLSSLINCMKEVFHKVSSKVSQIAGEPATFVLAVSVIILWGANGPLFNFSDTWQLIINTATTIVTFLMVFLIQNTQNRDAKAIHLKLDEILRSIKGARNDFLDIENVSDEELEKYHEEFKNLHEKYTKELKRRKSK